MKTKLAQLVSFVNKIDPRQLQVAYFAVLFFTTIVIQGPLDGGTGPFA